MGLFRKSKGRNEAPESGPASPGIPGGIAAYRHTLGRGKAPVKTPPGGEFIKTGDAGPEESTTQEPASRGRQGAGVRTLRNESKYRRLAKFLILIGGEEAARILSQLPAEDVERISGEIAAIRGMSAPEAGAVLEEFRALLSSSRGFTGTPEGSSSGGLEAARRLLYAAFGTEQGEAFLNRAVPESRKNPFAFLEDFSGEQLALLLKDESVAAAALVLSRLPPQKSAAVFKAAEGERKAAILRRIARMERANPEALERAAEALREKVRRMGAPAEALSLDGIGALTAILRSSDLAFGDRLLQELEAASPDLGRDLKERLYTLEDVIRAEDRPIQEKLRSMSDRDIALLLKGRPPEFAAKIYANLSSGRAAAIREESDLMGAVPRAEADGAARDFLSWFRLNREEGRIILMDETD